MAQPCGIHLVSTFVLDEHTEVVGTTSKNRQYGKFHVYLNAA